MTLLEDLKRGEAETAKALPCPACEYLDTLDEETKPAMRDALAGTIGIRKLAAIMQKWNTGIGRRTIERHRREEHTP